MPRIRLSPPWPIIIDFDLNIVGYGFNFKITNNLIMLALQDQNPTLYTPLLSIYSFI